MKPNLDCRHYRAEFITSKAVVIYDASTVHPVSELNHCVDFFSILTVSYLRLLQRLLGQGELSAENVIQIIAKLCDNDCGRLLTLQMLLNAVAAIDTFYARHECFTVFRSCREAAARVLGRICEVTDATDLINAAFPVDEGAMSTQVSLYYCSSVNVSCERYNMLHDVC